MSIGLLIAVLTIAAHSYSRFRRIHLGWTIVVGVFFLIALSRIGADLQVLNINAVMFLTQAVTSWGLFFGLYYAFSGRKQKAGAELRKQPPHPSPEISRQASRPPLAERAFSRESSSIGPDAGARGEKAEPWTIGNARVLVALNAAAVTAIRARLPAEPLPRLATALLVRETGERSALISGLDGFITLASEITVRVHSMRVYKDHIGTVIVTDKPIEQSEGYEFLGNVNTADYAVALCEKFQQDPNRLRVETTATNREPDSPSKQTVSEPPGSAGEENPYEYLIRTMVGTTPLASEASSSSPSSTGICDLCVSGIGPSARRYSASQMKTAVRRELRPPESIDRVGHAVGMAKESFTEKWIQRVMADTTDWAMCDSCAARVEQYLH